MAKKNKAEGYLTAKEARAITRANRKITNELEKKRKRKNVPESEYLTTMHDLKNAVEFDNLHTYFFTDAGTVKAVDGVEEIRLMDSVCKDAFDDIYVGLHTEHFEDKTSRYAVILQATDRDALMKEISAVKDKLCIQVETRDGIKGPVWE